MHWIREAADKLPEPEPPKSVEVMEIDELHHWIGQKKELYGCGLQFAAVPVESSPTSWVVVDTIPQKDSAES